MNTAIELWFDDGFLVSRIKEQELYLLNLEIRLLDGLNRERYEELKYTAEFIKARLEHQFSRPHPCFNTYE